MSRINHINQSNNGTRVFLIGNNSIFFNGWNRGVENQNKNDKQVNVKKLKRN